MAVPAALPAVEAAARDLQVARAPDGVARPDHPGLERGHGGDHLEGRARRIGALHRLVGQRPVGIVGQALVIGHRDAAHEEVGIEAGRRGDGAQIAGLAVHHHRRGALAAQPRLDIGLQAGIHRQLQVRAGLPVAAVKLAHHPARGVDLHALGAGLAAQQVLLLGLQPDLADLEARDHQHRLGVFHLRQVIIADRADITDHMGEVAALRIDPG